MIQLNPVLNSRNGKLLVGDTNSTGKFTNLSYSESVNDSSLVSSGNFLVGTSAGSSEFRIQTNGTLKWSVSSNGALSSATAANITTGGKLQSPTLEHIGFTDLSINSYNAGIKFSTHDMWTGQYFNWDMTNTGHFQPATSGTFSIGSASFPVQTVTANNLTSSSGQALNLQTGSAGTLWSVSTDSIGAKSSISSSNSVGVIGLSTVDGSDNGRLEIRGYGTDGSVSASTRGGAIYLNGNENTGSVSIIAGNMSGAGTGISFSTGGALRITTNSNGHFFPGGDNAQLCGAAGSRWSAIWAANGTIQTSDGREKNTITNSTLGLDFINALRPVSYKWTVGHNVVTGNGADENGNILPPTITPVSGTRTHWGLIAQEVKAALPSGVDFGGWILTDIEDEDSQQGLRYDQFIAPMIKAIQELSTLAASLQSLAASLQSRIDTLEGS